MSNIHCMFTIFKWSNTKDNSYRIYWGILGMLLRLHQGTYPGSEVSGKAKSFWNRGQEGLVRAMTNGKRKGVCCSMRCMWNTGPEDLAELQWLMLCVCVVNECSRQEPVPAYGPGAAMHQLQLQLLLNFVPSLFPPYVRFLYKWSRKNRLYWFLMTEHLFNIGLNQTLRINQNNSAVVF